MPHTLTPDEIARRGREFYRQIQPRLGAEDRGRIMVIDVGTGEYELGSDHLTTARRARERFGDAPLFAVRIGSPALARIGGRATSRRPS